MKYGEWRERAISMHCFSVINMIVYIAASRKYLVSEGGIRPRDMKVSCIATAMMRRNSSLSNAMRPLYSVSWARCGYREC